MFSEVGWVQGGKMKREILRKMDTVDSLLLTT
jgi:hypothetical protein